MVMIVGHGTVDAEGQAECHKLVQSVRNLRPDVRVEMGFLELCPPPISDTVADAVADGVTDITVVPLMLLGAGHSKGDIPAAMELQRRRHPQVNFSYASPLGVRPELIEAIDERLCNAVPEEQRERSGVALIGRGTTDPDANADLAKVARLLWEGRPWQEVEAGFVSLAEPSVTACLDRMKALGVSQAVVTPYFLFTGVLERRIRQQADEWAERNPEVTVAHADYFGPEQVVAELVWTRADEAVAGQARANCDTCLYRATLPGFEHQVGAPQTLHFHPDDDHTHGHHDHHHGHHHH
ncbi:sirohydrochlorin chelatase [Haloglycomyces albus]|uniref:sirohydrochlorin chelatase n=1 Tax=Haloglycomyces albus TaxID=526067 RepID=UPI0004AEE7F4|nr:sirohydrochlorin chelatase [Haloglycomyces albus]